MTKRLIKKEIDTMYFGGGTAEDTIKELQALIDEHGAGNITLDTSSSYGSDDSYVAVLLSRLETDEEEYVREYAAARQKIRNDEYERVQYESLKKKFG